MRSKKKYDRPGQPEKYDPKYCKEIVEFMAKGFNVTSYAAHIGVSRDSIYEWGRNHPEFSDAIKKAREAQEYFFMKNGIDGMTGKNKNFNTGPWAFMLKNCCGWSDKVETQNNTFVKVEPLESFLEGKEDDDI